MSSHDEQNNLTKAILVKINTLETVYKQLINNKADIEKVKRDLVTVTKCYMTLMKKLIEYDISYIINNKVEVSHECFQDMKEPSKADLMETIENVEELYLEIVGNIKSMKDIENIREYRISDIYLYPQYDGNDDKLREIVSLSDSVYDKYIFHTQHVSVGSYISFETFYNAGDSEDISMVVYDDMGQVLKRFQEQTNFLRTWVSEGEGDYHIVHAYYEVK